ncbi:MAG: molybdopterin cofactor-binding domain-containing protein [Novosphingobium sp.]
MELSRRKLLIGSAVGGGLIVAWALTPRRYPLPLSPAANEYAFGAWLKIAADGMVTVAVPQLEMGQGITTVLPQIVAMELGADWRRVAVEPAPLSPAYANVPLAARWAELWMPAFAGVASAPDSALARRFAESNRFMATADGQSLAAYERPAREAAAAARTLLAKVAASRWGVDWEKCAAEGGFISHGNRKLPFGALAVEAAAYDSPGSPVLRPEPPAERPLPGAALPGTGSLRFPRLDLPSKVAGSHLFAGDVRLPNMVFAAIRHAPVGEAALGKVEEAPARGMDGFLRLVRGQDWLAAAATNWWAAERALAAIAPRFIVKHPADSEQIDAALTKGLHWGDAATIAKRGDPDAWLSGNLSLAVRYDVAPALHATLETATATARFSGGRLELWVASQAPEAARRAAATALGLSLSDVVLYPVPAGGSFDRRLEHDHAVEAALIAREVARPVQLTWSRWQEHVAGRPRTPVAAVLAARTAPTGEPTAWKARLAMPASGHEFGRRLFGSETPWAAVAGAEGDSDALAMAGAEPPYALQHLLIQHVSTRIGLPTGRLRGNAHGYTAFFTESFMDELAFRAKREPLAFRMALLGDEPRLAQCLQRVSALANWNGGNDGSGQGIACHRIGNGRIAAVATARRDENGVRVDKISAVADIGRIVNLDIARQQIEGGLIFGMGLAIGASTGYAQGLPLTGRLRELGLPLLADCPDIAVEFIDSGAEPADPGELGVAVVAPAIANALFSATGLRFRKLPLLSEDI